MRIIGLCGRSGSGKGLFCSIAAKHGIKIIDCDAVYKDMVSRPSPCLSEIASTFGNSVIKDSALDRRALAAIVFSDREKLNLLNSISHKYIISDVESILSSYAEEDIVILDAPTLFESGIDSKCELIVGIIAPDELCVQRIIKRDNLSESDALMRLSNQLSTEFIVENSDHIIYNNSSAEEFESAVTEFIGFLKEAVL